jgi:MFS family permease
MSSKLTSVYAIETISGFAGSLIGIFVPVYLLSVGYSVRDVMLLSLIQVFAGLVAIACTAWFSRKIPLKFIMLSRIPVLIVLLGALASAHAHSVPIAWLAALQGLQFVLYYLPLHIFFILGSDEQTVGRQLGLLGGIPKLVSAGAPLMAGVIAARWGFNPLFVLTAVLYGLSAIPMTKLPNIEVPFSLSISTFRRLYSKYPAYFWLEVVENIQEELDQVIWPLVVYLTVRSTIQVGAVSTLIAVGSALFTYVVGHHADKSDKFKLLRVGGIVMLLLWAWRLGHLTPLSALIISVLVGFAGMLVNLPFTAIIYNLARANNPRDFIIFREISVGVGRVCVYVPAVLLAANLQHLFWLAIVAYGIVAVIPRFKRT